MVAQARTGNKVRWREDPALRRRLKDCEDKMQQEREILSEAVIHFRENKEQSGISLPGVPTPPTRPQCFIWF